MATAEANFQCIARLVIIGGRTPLREIFDNRCPPSCLPKMLQNPDTVKRLREAHLTKSQWNRIYPTPGVYGKSADFDSSLLLKLLRTMCNITPPVTGWDARPTYTDHSLAADLARVNYYLDFVYSHVNQSVMKITDDEYFSLCEEISNTLLRITEQISPERRTEWQKVVHNFLKDPLVVEEGKNVQELLRWYENDTEVMRELIPELTTSTQVRSLQTVFQEKTQRIKDLLKEELRSKTQGVQVVETPSSKGVEIGTTDGTTHIAVVPARQELQIKEMFRSTENLSSSASGSREARARLRLYINCEIKSGPGLREESSQKNVASLEPKGDVKGALVGDFTSCQQQSSSPAAVIKDANVIHDLFKDGQKTPIAEVQKRMEHLTVKGLQGKLEATTQITESEVHNETQDIEDQLEQEHSTITQGEGAQERLEGSTHVTETAARKEPQVIKDQLEDKLVSAGSPDAAACSLSMTIDTETISEPGQQGESSQGSQGKVKGATITSHVSSDAHILGLIAAHCVLASLPRSRDERNDFLRYLEKMSVIITGVKKGSVIITLECGSLETLDVLWEEYKKGHVDKVVQKCFVTGDIIEEFGEVKLTTTISEEEYKACRERFLQVSVKTSPEGVSADAGETETESMDQIESGSQAKSESKMTVEVSHFTSETVAESFPENNVEAASYAESEKCEVSERGGVWKVQDIQAAACITFPPIAVTKPVLFRCTLWESTTHFPPLKKDEALVSSVIVLTYDDPLSSNFTGEFEKEVTVALSHSACNLKGYEVVIRELVDSDNNHWRDLETTNIWQASGDIQYDPSAKPRIPFAEAKVTRCSAFAVVCRLKSYTFSTNALGKCDFTCVVEEYPDVRVTIPASVVHENRDFLLTVKVQEIPQQWFDDSDIIIGPVLHITCSPAIQLGKPATITMPISLQADTIDFSEFSSENVRVLVNSDEETSDWKEITDQLPRPADLANGVVTFQATHFTRFLTWLEKMPFLNLESRATRLTKRIPLEAGFFACLCSSGCPGNSQLRFCCYPNHIESQVRKNICSTYEVFRYGNGDSYEPLCQGDVIFVILREGLELSEDTSEDELQLRFRSDKKFESDVVVRDPCGHVPQIEFFKHLDEKPPRNKKLCKLSIIPTPTQTSNNQRCPVKTGNPSDDELEELSTKLGDKWEKLGRRLGFNQPKLTAFHKENERLFDKAHQMLMSWKEREGSDATYQVLYDALIHNLVACRLLAEEHCCN